MITFITEIFAIDPRDGKGKKFNGIRVMAKDEASAREFLDQNGFQYCSIVGSLESASQTKKPKSLMDRLMNEQQWKFN